MKYLPYEKYTLNIPLSIEEAQRRLLENVEPERDWSYIMRNDTKPYTGVLGAKNFTINRIIRYGNSFLPIITGRFTSEKGRTTLHIRMRLRSFVLLFVSFWTSILTLTCIGSLLSSWLDAEGPAATPDSPVSSIGDLSLSPALLAPFGMLLSGYALTMICFKYESTRSKRFLAKLLEAAPAKAKTRKAPASSNKKPAGSGGLVRSLQRVR